MNLLAFAASHRPDSHNRRLVKIAANHIQAQGASMDIAEYGEFDAPLYNDETFIQTGVPESARAFARRAEAADALAVAVPEYNWSYPGSLKSILDWTSRIPENPLAGKPVLLMSASPSARGGVLGLEHLRAPLSALGMLAYPRAFLLGQAHQAWDESSGLLSEQQQRTLETILNDFLHFAKRLSCIPPQR